VDGEYSGPLEAFYGLGGGSGQEEGGKLERGFKISSLI